MAWAPTAELESAVKDLRALVQVCSGKKPQALWRQVGQQLLPASQLSERWSAALDAYEHCPPAGTAGLLAYLMAEGSTFGELPRIMCALLQDAAPGSSDPLSSPAAAAAHPGPLANRPFKQGMTACSLLGILVGALEHVCDASASSPHSHHASIAALLDSLQLAGLGPALCHTMAHIHYHRAQLPPSAAVVAAAQRPSSPVDFALECSGLAAHVASILLQALLRRPALPTAHAAPAAAPAAASDVATAAAAASKRSATWAAQLTRHVCEGVTVALMSGGDAPVARLSQAQAPDHALPVVHAWAGAAGKTIMTATEVWYVSLGRCGVEEGPPPSRAAQAAAAATWRWMAADPSLLSLLLATICRSQAVPLLAKWADLASSLLSSLLSDREARGDGMDAAKDLVAVSCCRHADLAVLAQLALCQLGEGTSVFDYVLCRVFKHAASRPEAWGETVLFVSAALSAEPQPCKRAANAADVAAWVAGADGADADNQAVHRRSAMGAMRLLSDMAELAPGLEPHLWMLKAGAVARCEAWLRSSQACNPNDLHRALVHAVNLAIDMTALLLQCGRHRRLTADTSAASLSLAATARKLAHTLSLVPGIIGIDSILQDSLERLLDAHACLDSSSPAASPAGALFVHCMAVQLLQPYCDSTLLTRTTAGATRRHTRWACALATLLPRLHGRQLADVTAAAGAPAALLQLMSHLLNPRRPASGSPAGAGSGDVGAGSPVEGGHGEIVVSIARLTLVALATAGEEPSWLDAAEGLREGVASVLAVAKAAPLRWWDVPATDDDVPGVCRARMTPTKAATSVEQLHFALAEAVEHSTVVAPRGGELTATWDTCLMATQASPASGSSSSGGGAGGSGSSKRPFLGCWHLGCTNLGGPSEAALKLMSCDLCRKARYCSKECQQAAWQAGHRAACKEWRQGCEHAGSGATPSV